MLDCCAGDSLLELKEALLDALLDCCVGDYVQEQKQALLEALLDCSAGYSVLELKGLCWMLCWTAVLKIL